jgi:dienelactone hydrolase
MSIIRSIFVKLPAARQDAIVEKKFKDGSIFRLAVFDMLLRSVEEFGADTEELRAAAESPAARDSSLSEILRGLALDLGRMAESAEKSGDAEKARDAFRRSAVYALLLDWIKADPAAIAENYALAMPAFDRFRALAQPPMEKFRLPFRGLWISAHYRAPQGADGAPAVLIVQGNDEVKELNVGIEDAALERGMAILDLDPPGWGESYLSGSRCRDREDYELGVKTAIDWLQARPEIDPGRIGAFGLSYGGLLSPYAAGLDGRIGAAVGLGGPSWSAREVRSMRKNLPAAQKRRGFLYTGAKTEKELLGWSKRMEFETTLRKVSCPALLVYGSEDEFVRPKRMKDNAAAIGPSAELRIIKGQDHMCSRVFSAEICPAMMDWLAEKLSIRV